MTGTSPPPTESDHGSGSSLSPEILLTSGIATLVACVVTATSIWLQLKNYRKPVLQRMVIRIMIMVPLYAVSSLIALFSLEAAFVIDAIRDIYEAFVIYCFFHLLVAYLGGERSLLITLYGRPPKPHLFPVNIFKREFDGSDPFTFLWIRRGIFQYVYIKPTLAAVTLILKASGVYNEGNLTASSGYLWVSIIYNVSICVALYCLAIFWVCINEDIKPFRPMPKFLCVKGILFFSFWQAIGVSILVSAGLITHVGPYKDAEHISLAITDALVCFEMPFFAIAHTFAFSYTDYIDPNTHYAARMPMFYAIRDAFGYVDVLEDSRATLKGGVSYQKYEPVEGGMHQGYARDRRIRAGLRYAKGGQQKYWLPMPEDNAKPGGPVNAVRGFLDDQRILKDGYAPLLQEQEEDVIHDETRAPPPVASPTREMFLSATADPTPFSPPVVEDPDGELEELEFHAPDSDEEENYAESRKLLFGDYNYPCIDVSSEAARRTMWDEEERILSDRRAAAFSPLRTTAPAALSAAQRTKGYGAIGQTPGSGRAEGGKGKTKFYGAAAEGVDASRERAEVTSPRKFDERGAIIDMSPDAPKPDIKVDGVQLSLTHRNSATAVPKRVKKPSNSPTGSKSTSGLAAPAPRPTLSNRSSTASFRSGQSSPQQPGQPREDAVDLVVEDPKAAEDEMAYERRKGEPAVRQTGHRKVYKAAYTVEDESGDERDVEVEREIEEGVEDPRRGDRPEIDRTKVKVGGKEEGEEDRGANVAEMTIVRAATPPPHATLEWTGHASPKFEMNPEDNPWA
ncbi:hypothetical protein FRB90_001179 [Tulasnella sp. 427]|nr:hypothetical protein FRB90_001179 [Tulasnella sp. 427]